MKVYTILEISSGKLNIENFSEKIFAESLLAWAIRINGFPDYKYELGKFGFFSSQIPFVIENYEVIEIEIEDNYHYFDYDVYAYKNR